jgi:hypothetical protein
MDRSSYAAEKAEMRLELLLGQERKLRWVGHELLANASDRLLSCQFEFKEPSF